MSDKAKAAASATVARMPGAAQQGDADESLDFLAPSQAADEIGRLAHYRILKVLGRGGMGTVFLAEDPRLHRLIALKVMLPSIAQKKSARERFTREAHATAAIEHDHIVTIYEVHEDRGVPYLAMQFLKGMTLDDWLKAGKTLNVPQIMRIGKEIAKGLAAAHSSGLIHRDIKPSNIWLDATNKGRVKILDFGLARPTNEDTHLTQEGMILGTPAYMSPEQARGQVVDGRSDLFSLGCVLYRLCTGRLPFSGKDPMSMLVAITTQEPPPLDKLNGEVPGALAQLIHQLLAKNPQERPESARVVVQTIQNIEREWAGNAKTTATPALAPKPAAAEEKTTLTPPPQADADPMLEESVITDLELHVTQLPGLTPARAHFTWVFAGLGGVLLTILAVSCCLGVMIFSEHGAVRVIAVDDGALAHLQTVGVTVWDHRKKAHLLKGSDEQRLPSGGYHVDAGSLPKGMQVSPDPFTLHRDETLELKLRSAPAVLKAEKPALERVTAEKAKRLQEQWAKYLGREITESNLLNMKLVLIPAGEFSMGSPLEYLKQQQEEVFGKKPWFDKYKKNVPAEVPQHTVRITKPFYLGMHEVTFGQFARFVASDSYQTEMEKTKQAGMGWDNGLVVRKVGFNWRETGFEQAPQANDRPVCNLTWADAEAFCKWLSKRENKTYRLPTEAEWEYACRAGTSTPWYFSDDPKIANKYIVHYLLKELTAGKGAQPVGSKKRANEFGLFDMHGNVEEMCADVWSETYYKTSPADDPPGPLAEAGKLKVARGGSFLEPVFACRSAYRNPVDPLLGHVQIGFRVVCEIVLTD